MLRQLLFLAAWASFAFPLATPCMSPCYGWYRRCYCCWRCCYCVFCCCRHRALSRTLSQYCTPPPSIPPFLPSNMLFPTRTFSHTTDTRVLEEQTTNSWGRNSDGEIERDGKAHGTRGILSCLGSGRRVRQQPCALVYSRWWKNETWCAIHPLHSFNEGTERVLKGRLDDVKRLVVGVPCSGSLPPYSQPILPRSVRYFHEVVQHSTVQYW